MTSDGGRHRWGIVAASGLSGGTSRLLLGDGCFLSSLACFWVSISCCSHAQVPCRLVAVKRFAGIVTDEVRTTGD
ncbi:hypothetical protein OAO87_00525 [bacterium]|nr:hypothetical protein [bacterium]